MKKTVSLTTVWIACALVLGACGGGNTRMDMRGMDDAGTPPIDHGDPPPDPEPIDCAVDPHSRFSGEVTALSDRAPIAGAEVCVLDHPEIPCATTDATGFYQLDCAPEGDAAIAFRADGFAPGVWLWAGVVGEAYTDLDISLATDAENTGYLSPTGVAYPDGTSSLVTIAPYGNVAGMTAALRTGAGEGPFYSADQGGRIDPNNNSLPGEQELAFFVVEPWDGWREVEIELVPGAGASRCAQLGGAWLARDGMENVVRVPVQPGMESVIWVQCD